MKRKKKLLFAISVFIIILVFAFDVRLQIASYTIKSPEIKGEVSLALLTDLHSCNYGENQKNLLDKIAEYEPDAVLLGGDIFDDVLEDADAKTVVKSLAKKYKTYYVSGNHEWWSGRMDEMFGFLSASGVKVLRGNGDILNADENEICIWGIDDPEVNTYDYSFSSWEKQLEAVGKEAGKKSFNILLSHRPEYAKQYMEYDFDIVLSGHAHGGQFRLPFIMNGLYAPNQGWFPDLAGGIYDFGGKKMIVSRGLSRESTRIPRIFNRPQLVFVNLVSE